MVAAAIMAVVLAVATQAIGSGARREARVERSTLAMLEARSRLDEVGADIALAPGVSSGQDGEMAWRVTITPTADAAGSDARLMDVQVDVSENDRPVFLLRSMRLADGAPS